MGPLEGVKVLDLTRAVAGPVCAFFLTLMGAEVVKVEHPKYGDDTRHFACQRNGVSGQFVALNRGRKGITIDMTKPEGQELIRKMVPQFDVLVENFQPGTLKKWGIDYEVLKEINPRLIMCCMSGFGQYGSMSQLPGYDIVGQAMSGIMETNGWPDGPPTKVGCLIGDQSTGMTGLAGVLAALYSREKTGKGQLIDISMQDVLIQYYDIPTYTLLGYKGGRTGNRLPTIAPFDTYPTKDGRWAIIACANNNLFEKLCSVMGKPELAQDERFATNPKRVENVEAMTEAISSWSKRFTMNELSGLLVKNGIPTAPIMNIEEVLNLPHVKEREMLIELEDSTMGKVQMVGSSIKMMGTPLNPYGSAPKLGEHNEEVFGRYLGLGKDEVSELKAKEII
ncbi:MAG: CoA transferase [Firmicutes bacterium]|nr:CoA transferase [Bacillota bacterium]